MVKNENVITKIEDSENHQAKEKKMSWVLSDVEYL